MLDVLSGETKDIIIKKIDNSFPIEQFLIGLTTTYRLVKNCFGGGIICSGRFTFKISIIENIPSKIEILVKYSLKVLAISAFWDRTSPSTRVILEGK